MPHSRNRKGNKINLLRQNNDILRTYPPYSDDCYEVLRNFDSLLTKAFSSDGRVVFYWIGGMGRKQQQVALRNLRDFLRGYSKALYNAEGK